MYSTIVQVDIPKLTLFFSFFWSFIFIVRIWSWGVHHEYVCKPLSGG